MPPSAFDSSDKRSRRLRIPFIASHAKRSSCGDFWNSAEIRLIADRHEQNIKAGGRLHWDALMKKRPDGLSDYLAWKQ